MTSCPNHDDDDDETCSKCCPVFPEPLAQLKYPVIVVDCETTGLLPENHIAVEVAWWDLSTNERKCFIPRHSVEFVLSHGDPVALEMNGYRERLLGQPMDNGENMVMLGARLHNNTMAGSNPGFDARFLKPFIGEPWHHRMWDLSAYAAGVLGLNYLPGLIDVCGRLDVPPPDHTAEGDVTATGLCFLALMAQAIS